MYFGENVFLIALFCHSNVGSVFFCTLLPFLFCICILFFFYVYFSFFNNTDSMASTEQSRPSVAAPLSSIGLDVLLSAVQNADVESTLHILHKLDDLLATGSAHRIHGLIIKDTIEYLLNAFVNAARDCSPNYSILVPLLKMLAKVGHKDRQIGTRAEKLGAVLLTLNLLKLNAKHGRRTAACLCVIQVFSSTASTANLIGENQGLDVIYELLPQYTAKHLHILKG